MSARALALGVCLAVALASGAARAEPTVWAKARDPRIEERRDVLHQVDALIARYHRVGRMHVDAAGLAVAYLEEARTLLERAGAATSPDHDLRFRFAEVLESLHDLPGATRLYESIVRADAPPPMRAKAWAELAICYVRAGRHGDEIHAYGEALALEPGATARSRLFANRAEALMAIGDLEASVSGYRAALAELGATPYDMARYGVTTFWGLAVALDRSGDLEQAIRQIQLARTYDFADRSLADPSWFFVPAYDEAWYTALGHWATARHAELAAVRVEAYGRAVGRWEEYLARAPADDRWAPIARVRLKQCERERDAYVRSLHLRRPAAASASPRRSDR
jgi:tetratricopeptide (TPR) repeat protein